MRFYVLYRMVHKHTCKRFNFSYFAEGDRYLNVKLEEHIDKENTKLAKLEEHIFFFKKRQNLLIRVSLETKFLNLITIPLWTNFLIKHLRIKSF